MELSKDSAIIYEQNFITGNSLREKIERTRQFFRNNITDFNSPVALFMKRSPDLIVMIFSLLEAGIIFLPLDVEQPLERNCYMLKKAKVKTVITDSKTDSLLREEGRNLITVQTIYRTGTETGNRILEKQKKSKSAYILFTSGTTGMPKAVEVRRQGLENFINGITDIIDFSTNSRIASFTNHTFDIFFLESILSLTKGLTVILATQEERTNPKKIISILSKYEVDILQMTPSMMKMIEMYDKQLKCLGNISYIMLGGEAFPIDLLQRLQKNTSAKIYNMYGPTETTIWSAVADLTDTNKVHIGKPIKNTKIYLLDEQQKLVKENAIGEIAIAGQGLAKGYVDDRELTQQKFINMPDGQRVYLTGDLGRIDEEGCLICLGRKDNQVKLRGHRIELEEIELVFKDSFPVADVTVCFHNSPQSNSLNVFYIASRVIEKKKIVELLKKKLPQYMIPDNFQRVKKFIYNASGKLDKKALLEKYKRIIEDNYPDTGIAQEDEITVIKIIKNLLDEPAGINLETSISELDLNSLQYMQLIVELEETFDIEFGVECLAQGYFGTVGDVERYVK